MCTNAGKKINLDTDLQELDTLTRNLICKFRYHHEHAASIQDLKGKGLINIYDLNKRQVENMKKYFSENQKFCSRVLSLQSM